MIPIDKKWQLPFFIYIFQGKKQASTLWSTETNTTAFCAFEMYACV